MKKSVLLISIMAIVINVSHSQDSLIFLDGKILETEKIIKIDTSYNIIEYMYKGKEKRSRLNNVFSIKTKDSTTYYYTPQKDEFNINEMERFIYGENAALKSYDTKIISGTSFLLGFGSAFLMPAFHIPQVFSPIIPGIYVGLSGKKFGKDQSKCYSTRFDTQDELYRLGYCYKAKSKRINQSIIYSAVGLTLGVITAYFVYE